MKTCEQLLGTDAAEAWMLFRRGPRRLKARRGVLAAGAVPALVFEGDVLLGRADAVARRGARMRARLFEPEAELLRGDPDLPGEVDDLFRGVIKVDEAIGIVSSSPDGARWRGGVVPFEVDPALPDSGRVTAAIAAYHAATTVRFVARDPASVEHVDHVRISPGIGCASFVGRRGGMQPVYLGSECSAGNCMHELGHALGLWHEQSRENRDDFVTILGDNIKPGALSNFDQHVTDGDDIGDYDFDSIMHYPADAFARSAGLVTIRAKKPLPAGVVMGQRDHLSHGDVLAINALYA